MKNFPVIVRYMTVGGHRKKYEFTVAAVDKREARAAARALYDAERKRINKPAALQATITAVVVQDAIEIVAAAPAPAGLVEKADLIDQIKALIATPPADPRIGKLVQKTSGDYEFEGVIVGVVTKLSGAERFVVEDSRGLLLIMNAGQVGL